MLIRRRRWFWSVQLFAALLLLSEVAAATEPRLDERQILEWLRELKPLQKVHYSWPVPVMDISEELLFEYTRLTHAISLSGEWGQPAQIDRAVMICKQVNAEGPSVPASIGINYSVWHRRFGKDLPPTDTGSTHQAELEYLQSRLEAFRLSLAEANKRHGTDVKISAILFDSERFHARPKDEEWNRAITAKYDAAYDLVRTIFPKVRIEWYGRGAVQPGASPSGWSQASYFTLKEKGESFGCSLYQVPEIGYTREIFRRTVRNAEQHGCQQVTPWIALASGYRRQVDKYHAWSFDWNYDLIYSWKLGAEINHPWFGAEERHERFAPWNRSRIAIFYPEPFGRVPHWPEHFVAYVRGAHLIKSLPGE